MRAACYPPQDGGVCKRVSPQVVIHIFSGLARIRLRTRPRWAIGRQGGTRHDEEVIEWHRAR